MWLRSYFKKLLLSLSDARFYQAVVLSPARNAWLFFTFWTLLFGLVQGLAMGIRFFPIAQQEVTYLANHLQQTLPDDIVINWESPILNISSAPLTVTFPPKSKLNDTFTTKNMATVLDSQIPLSSISGTLTESSAVIISKEYISLNTMTGEWNHLKLSDYITPEVWTANKSQIVQSVTEIGAQIQNNSVLLFILVMGFQVVVLLLSNIWQAFLYSLMIYLIRNIVHLKISYSKILAICLYLIVVIELAQTVTVSLFNVSLQEFSSILFWIYCLFIYKQVSQIKSVPENKS